MGFSGRAIALLKQSGVKNLITVTCLTMTTCAQASRFFNWRPFRSCTLTGQFVGGSDIMSEMFESGELQTLLKTPVV